MQTLLVFSLRTVSILNMPSKSKSKIDATSRGANRNTIEQDNHSSSTPASDVVTRGDLDRVVADLDTRLAVQQQVIANQIMTRLGKAQPTAHNTETRRGARSRGFRRLRRSHSSGDSDQENQEVGRANAEETGRPRGQPRTAPKDRFRAEPSKGGNEPGAATVEPLRPR